MLPKKCLYCDRRFSKAEHLKRHQRSHTGERPYRCSQCQKSFSRSDVLIRHLKNHPQSSGDGENAPAVDAVDGTQGQIMESSSVDPSAAHIQSESFTPQSVIDPSLQPSSLEGYLDRRSSHPMASGLDHLALLASQQNAGRASMDANMTDAARTPMLHAGEIQDWNFDVSGSNYEPQRMASVSNSQHNHQLKFSNSSPKPLSTSSNSASRFDLGNHMNFTRQNAMQMHMSPAMSGIAQDRPDMMPHELQTWFDQFDMESQMQSDILQDFGSAAGIFHQQSVNPSPVASYSQKTARAPSSPSPSAIIPTERFAKVERCWPNRSSIYGQQRLMLTLWRNCISKAEDNLFSTANLTTETVEQNPQCGSRWGLDDDCRDRLQAIFVTSDNANIDRTSDTFQSPEGLSPSSGRASTVHTDPAQTTMPNPANFPPAEIFDIGLDLYFRQFHPLMPFIHVPTFAPKTAPTSMLLVMCLIGLTVLETKAARAFVRTAFPKTLEKVCNELVSPPRSEEARINQMSSLASAILMLNLSEITGDEKHQVQQLLYTNVIATAQQHGLLSSSESQPLEKKIFDNILDLDAKWKAWSRVESAKRLIICLTMVDTWYSATSHTSPALRLDDLQFILPCDPALFQATSSTKWNQLITRGFPMCMPNVVLSLDKLSLPDLCRPLDVIGMTGILCIIRLRVSESFHRLLSGTSRRAVSQSFVPWKIYELDARAKLTQPLVVQLIHTYGPMLCNMNPNCMTLWHNINIMLLADLRLFELGAGCAGAESARQALDDIAIWTTTAAARRACLHAGQSFRLMSNRRASDGDPFHASSGLFISALILGLYVFMSPTRVEEIGHANSGFDLTDEIDWEVVGNEGLASVQNGNVDDAAVNFIRGGGKVRFNGVVHEPGYNSARRILLDYARLLEDIGRWRVKVNQYSRVLRIMSDALVDVDMSGQ